MITQEDVDLVKYFAKEKGDHTRYYRWMEISAEFEKVSPAYMLAHRSLVSAERNFDHELENLSFPDPVQE